MAAMSGLSASDPRELVAFAEAAVDQVDDLFRAGLGAAPARFKGEGDFATEVDLQIEQQLRVTLSQLTGIPVFGEESGGSLEDTAVSYTHLTLPTNREV